MKAASAIVHISPALGAAFTEYTAEFENAGELGETLAQRFLYVIDGAVHLNAPAKIIFSALTDTPTYHKE